LEDVSVDRLDEQDAGEDCHRSPIARHCRTARPALARFLVARNAAAREQRLRQQGHPAPRARFRTPAHAPYGLSVILLMPRPSKYIQDLATWSARHFWPFCKPNNMFMISAFLTMKADWLNVVTVAVR
jgi:hypothetical protein